MADGVEPKDAMKVLAAPGGVERAFKSSPSSKPHASGGRAANGSMRNILTGDVVMTFAWNSRVAGANRKQQPQAQDRLRGRPCLRQPVHRRHEGHAAQGSRHRPDQLSLRRGASRVRATHRLCSGECQRLRPADRGRARHAAQRTYRTAPPSRPASFTSTSGSTTAMRCCSARLPSRRSDAPLHFEGATRTSFLRHTLTR